MTKKLFITLLTTLTILATSSLTAFAGTSDWATTAVESIIEKGVVPAELQSDYQKPITRDEFAHTLHNTLMQWTKDGMSLEKYLVIESHPTPKYSDTKASYVVDLSKARILSGTGWETFSPNENITREQAAKMLNGALYAMGIKYEYPGKHISDTSIADWAQESANRLAGYKIMNGTSDTSFSPKSLYTREEALATLNKLDEVIAEFYTGTFDIFDPFCDQKEYSYYTFEQHQTGVNPYKCNEQHYWNIPKDLYYRSIAMSDFYSHYNFGGVANMNYADYYLKKAIQESVKHHNSDNSHIFGTRIGNSSIDFKLQDDTKTYEDLRTVKDPMKFSYNINQNYGAGANFLRTPIQTLVEQRWNCDDSALLGARLMVLAGYSPLLKDGTTFSGEWHIALGDTSHINCSGDCEMGHAILDGVKYCITLKSLKAVYEIYE